jgi:hypothetical protein
VNSTANATRTLRTVESAVSGMRRLDCVRMVEDDHPRFYLVGVGHRFPVEREVSLGVAAVLLEQLPCRYERRGEKVS